MRLNGHLTVFSCLNAEMVLVLLRACMWGGPVFAGSSQAGTRVGAFNISDTSESAPVSMMCVKVLTQETTHLFLTASSIVFQMGLIQHGKDVGVNMYECDVHNFTCWRPRTGKSNGDAEESHLQGLNSRSLPTMLDVHSLASSPELSTSHHTPQDANNGTVHRVFCLGSKCLSSCPAIHSGKRRDLWR